MKICIEFTPKLRTSCNKKAWVRKKNIHNIHMRRKKEQLKHRYQIELDLFGTQAPVPVEPIILGTTRHLLVGTQYQLAIQFEI